MLAWPSGTPTRDLRRCQPVRDHRAMSDEPKQSSESEPAEETPGDERSRTAAQDLADGLDLMLRAARKAVRHVDPQNVESIGRRALDNLDALKKRRVEELRNEARRKLDPRRIEEIAEEAGKELMRVVERVAERVDSVVNRGSHPPDADRAEDDAAPETPGEDGTTKDAAPGHDPKKVRIADD